MSNRQKHYTRERRDYVVDTLDEFQVPLVPNNRGLPQAYRVVKDRMEKLLNEQREILVEKADYTATQSAVVVVLDQVYDHFARGHEVGVQGIDGESINVPYTINYSIFFDKLMKDKIKVRGKMHTY